MAEEKDEEESESAATAAEESSSGLLDVLTPIRRSSSTRGAGSGEGRSPMLLRSNSVKCGPGGPTGFDPEDPSGLPPRSPRPKPKSLTGGFPQSRTGSKKVYYML